MRTCPVVESSLQLERILLFSHQTAGITRRAAMSVLLTLGTSLAAIAPVHAQDREPAQPQARPGEGAAERTQEPDDLEEIIITAARIPTELLNLPFAAGQVDQQMIQRARQQLGLDESLVNIPGVFFQNRYNFAQDLRISIRGFGARANFGIRGIQLIADDIPLTMPDGQGNVDSIDLGSARSIEVIRGPVSAIYGAAGGGVINILTEDGPEEPFLSGRFSAGAYGFRQGQVKAGGQSGALNWIGSLSAIGLDGYRDHARYERTLFNSKFRYQPDESSSLTVVFNAVDSPQADDPGGLNIAEVEANRRQAAPRNLLFDAGETLQQQKLGLVWRKNLAASQDLLLRTYLIRRDFANLLPFDINSNGQGGSVDLDRKVAGIGGHWSVTSHGRNALQNRLVIGFDLAAQRDFRQRFANNEGELGERTTAQDEDVSTIGLFIEDTVTFSHGLALTVGGRLDQSDYSVSDRTAAANSGSTDFTEFSPMAGLVWSWRPAVNLYGNISTAFDPPAIAELANPDGPTGFNTALEPQTATNYEIGTRGSYRGFLRYELALFHIDVEDEIVPFELAGSGQAFFQNAGRSTHDGLEAALQAELDHGLTVTGSWTWSDFRYDRFTGSGGESFDGNRLPGVPEHLVHIELAWQHGSGFYAGADVLYAGSLYADNANAVEIEDYLVTGIRAGFRHELDGWVLEPFVGVNNLLDEDYFGNVRINAAFGRYYEPAPARNLYAGLELRWVY